MSEFKDRLRQLRKAMTPKMSQTAFGEMLGYTLDGYRLYEVGKIKEIPNSFVKLVCRSTGVSESWLRDGTGEMRVSDDDAIIERLRAERNWDKRHCDAARLLLHMTEDDIKLCMDALERTCAAFAEALHRQLSPREPTPEEIAKAEIERERQERYAAADREADEKLAALASGGETAAYSAATSSSTESGGKSASTSNAASAPSTPSSDASNDAA